MAAAAAMIPLPSLVVLSLFLLLSSSLCSPPVSSVGVRPKTSWRPADLRPVDDLKESCLPCRNGVSSRDCCSAIQLQPDPEDNSASLCSPMIPYGNSLVVDEGVNVDIECDAGTVCLSRCEWELSPADGANPILCRFDQYTLAGSMCRAAPVRLRSDLSSGRCGITIEGFRQPLQGRWTCRTYIASAYSDHINVTLTGSTLDGGVTVRTLMAITLPIGILLIIGLILILMWCVCPAWLALICCCCRRSNSSSNNNNQEKSPGLEKVDAQTSTTTTNNTTVAPSTGPTHYYDQPHRYPDHHEEAFNEESSEGASEFHGFASHTSRPIHPHQYRQAYNRPGTLQAGQRVPGPSAVIYEEPRTEPGLQVSRTARKISKPASMQNYTIGFGDQPTREPHKMAKKMSVF